MDDRVWYRVHRYGGDSPFVQQVDLGAPVQSYRDLVVWQVAMDLAAGVYEGTKRFPEDEKFGLRLQMRRAAVSIASNIAEGHGRVSRRDYLRYVMIARGSLRELETQLALATRIGYMADEICTNLLAQCDRLSRLITGLGRSLRKKP